MGKDCVVMGWDCLVALQYRRAEVGALADGSHVLPEVAVGCVGAHPTVVPFCFLSEFRRELPPFFFGFIGCPAVVRLPKKERVDDTPQDGPPFSLVPLSPRHR